MSYFNWTNPYQFVFGWPEQATVQPSQQFSFSDYTLPSQGSSIWTDPATGLTMDKVASSPYYNVTSEQTKTGYNWQGTRMDIYKTVVDANSIYSTGPYTNPLLPTYENPMNTIPYTFSTAQETYKSKMVYDKDLGKYVQVDELTGVQEMSYEDRVRLGAPDNLTPSDIARSLKRKDYYSGGFTGGSK